MVMRRSYGELTRHSERGPRHRLMLAVWSTLYAFVGMQMGWMLRPFVGSHDLPVVFFRNEPFTNAYVAILALFFGA
jgi:antibiotic biosynthesis monooxygenase (ABM) superfamily enzyme